MSWISITERVPSKEECQVNWGWFLVWRGSGRPDMSRYDGHDPEHCYKHGWKFHWDLAVTHWMPLPEAPK